jgi:hypothetical protein
MPPKKDYEKKKGGPVVAKEVDAAHYLRKVRPSTIFMKTTFKNCWLSQNVPLPLSVAEKQAESRKHIGEIKNIENLFPEWSNDDIWSEPLPPEKVPIVNYPSSLGIKGHTTISTFYNLAPDINKDPKKKKQTPKSKVSLPVQVELLVNEDGNPIPVIYRDDEANSTFNTYPQLRDFVQRKKPNDDDGVEDLVDATICDTFSVISEYAPRIMRAHPGDITRTTTVDEIHANYLWRAIHPKLASGKPVYNPVGKYAVRMFLAGKWRKVYVNDTIPLDEFNQPALAGSTDRLELWPMILSKAIYTVYTACG